MVLDKITQTLQNGLMKWSYSPHYSEHAKGHIFLGHEKKGACTITLTPAASMTQKELDRHGRLICRAVNSRMVAIPLDKTTQKP